MLRKLVLAGIVVGASASVPVVLQNNPQLMHGLPGPAEEAAPPQVPKVAMARTAERARNDGAPSGRKVRLVADGRGQFSADFKLNGRTVPAMIDTGASVVAINRSTARRIGLALGASDFTAEVETANGRTRAAMVRIDRLEVGRIAVQDVPAVVLDDEALGGTLIGMTFLSQLRRFGVESGALVLEQ